MNEDFFRDRARTVRKLAEKADPFTRIRLLELADRYERKPRKPTPIPAPKPLTDTAGLVEEVLSIPSGSLSTLVEGDHDGADTPIAPTLTDGLLADVIEGRDRR